MALEAVKIPADVQVEEKIVGPVSLRQLGLLMAGGGVGYTIWTFCQRSGYIGFPAIVASWFPLIIMAAFAFVKVSDVSLFRLCLLSYEKMQKPAVRIFGPRIGINITVRPGAAQEYKQQKKADEQRALEAQQNAQSAKSDLSELSAILDNGLNDLIKAPPKLSDTEMRRIMDIDSSLAKEAKVRERTTVAVEGDSDDEIEDIRAARPAMVRDIHPPVR